MKTNKWAFNSAIYGTIPSLVGMIVWYFIYPPGILFFIGFIVALWAFYGDHVMGTDSRMDSEIDKKIAEQTPKQ